MGAILVCTGLCAIGSRRLCASCLLAWLGASFDLSSAATIGVARKSCSRRSYFWICSCQGAWNGLANNIWYVLVPLIKYYNHTHCWYVLLQEAVLNCMEEAFERGCRSHGRGTATSAVLLFLSPQTMFFFVVFLIVCCAFYWDFFCFVFWFICGFFCRFLFFAVFAFSVSSLFLVLFLLFFFSFGFVFGFWFLVFLEVCVSLCVCCRCFALFFVFVLVILVTVYVFCDFRC